MVDFIFMLTRADRTIADAPDRLPEVIKAGVQHIGFKDVGVDFETLRSLADAIRASGATVYLEVVSLNAASEEASAQMAVELGVDVLMGGTRPEIVVPILSGTTIRYYPFPGTIVGNPSVLVGTIDSIAYSAAELLARDGVHGLDLLAYRFDGDVPELMRRIVSIAGDKPVIIAGSIDRAERVAAAVSVGAAGFTIGTAALDSVFVPQGDLSTQLSAVKKLVATLEA